MALPTIDSIIPYRLQLEDGEKMGALDDPGPLPEGMHQNPTLLYAALALIYRLREELRRRDSEQDCDLGGK